MRKILMAASLGLAAAIAAASPAVAESPASAKWSVETSDIGSLLDDAVTKAILSKHLPGFVDNEQINMARGMTLKQIQQFAADMVTDEKLAAIQADLDKLGK